MDSVKIAVIGAGVIGLSIAEAISRKIKDDIVVLERRDSFGQETSSRNSEVIHAGIYYPKGSFKSRLCLKGNSMLYELCREAGIRHEKCGKLIVATNKQEAAKIKKIYENALSAGAADLRLLTEEGVKELEPNIFALNGLFSGSTGIVDSHGLMNYLHKQARANGVMFALGQGVTGIDQEEQGSGGYIITAHNGEKIGAKTIINCAGLESDKIAEMAGFDVDQLDYRLHYCKGDYFSVKGSKGTIRHLVYPVPPEEGYGLGIHATLDLDGYFRLGPDDEYVKAINYEVDPGKRRKFYESAKTYLPWLEENSLMPDTSGIRPKLQGPGEGFRDFVIKEESANGFPGFINLIGIESPGLTASLAIGEMVSGMLINS